MTRPARYLEVWQRGLIWSLAALLMALVMMVGVQAYRTVFRPPPFYFTAQVYLPTRGDICPGDTVTYRPRLIVTRVPALVVMVRTLWGVSEQRTIVPDIQPKFFVWTEQEKGQPISRVVSFQLPASLPVGLYEIRGAASAMNSDAESYRVPFVIAESCFKKGGKT